MTKPAEIPQLVTELVDMSRGYLQQETLDPLKKVGRFAGYSIGGGVLLALGWLFLSVAAYRWILVLLPEGQIWGILAYLIAAVISLIVAGVSMKIAAGGQQR